MGDESRAPTGTVIYHFFSGHAPDAISDEDVGDINELLSFLSPGALPVSKIELATLVRQAQLYIAQLWDPVLDRRRIVGMATLVAMPDLLGRYGVINNVAVHPGYEGNGIGTRLVGGVIVWAKKFRMTHVDLTSRPERKAANHLYKKLGFELRATNCYRKTL